jgi:hypothetical protein
MKPKRQFFETYILYIYKRRKRGLMAGFNVQAMTYQSLTHAATKGYRSSEVNVTQEASEANKAFCADVFEIWQHGDGFNRSTAHLDPREAGLNRICGGQNRFAAAYLDDGSQTEHKFSLMA